MYCYVDQLFTLTSETRICSSKQLIATVARSKQYLLSLLLTAIAQHKPEKPLIWN